MAELIYVGDPMCSWCYGFGPEIDRVAEEAKDLSVFVRLGGLRPYAQSPMKQGLKDSIREHWGHVQERSGRPFDFSFFDRESFIYDTEPASRAVVAARYMDPDLALPLFQAIQEAFYAKGQDVRQREVLIEIAKAQGLDEQEFATAFDKDAIFGETRQDFVWAQRAGIQGFPALVLVEDGEATLIAMGYRTFEELRPALDKWL